jgi:hypothetical protein
MATDLSLLFRLGTRYDGAGVNAARADIAKLKQVFGPELAQTVSLSNKAFSEISQNVTQFAAQRIPLVGGAIARVSETVRGFNTESSKTDNALKSLSGSIQSISSASGKSVPQIASFLSSFVRLESQTKKNEAAFKFFGGSVDLIGNKTGRFVPELEKAGAALGELAAEGATTGASIAAIAGPIGIAVAALAALTLGAVTTARELLDLTKRTAEFQGKMFDLSQQTGVTVETLSALEVAAKKVGGEVSGGVLQSLVAFQRKLDDAQDPLSDTAKLFRDLSVDTSDTETALRQTLAALAAMPEGFKQTNSAAELFGSRGGKQILAILKETNGDIDALIQGMSEAGTLITTDTARAADILNDQLVDLDIQLRAANADIVRELIPALTDLAKTTVELIRATRPLLKLFSDIAGLASRPVVQGLRGLSIAVQIVTRDYKGLARSIKEANDAAKDIPAVKTPAPGPTQQQEKSPQQTAREVVRQADVVVAIVKRAAKETEQALSEAFERGRIDRDKEAKVAIASNKRVFEADKARIQALLNQKEIEIKALEGGTKEYENAAREIEKLQQDQLDAESLFNTTSRAIRARAAKERADSKRNEEQNTLDALISGFNRQIAAIEAQVRREEVAEADGLKIIEALEDAKIEARRKTLEAQKAIGFLTIENQKDFDNRLRQLDDEAAALRDQQIARRLQRERDAANRLREIRLAEIDTVLELQRTVGERTIATIESLAALRIKTEEQAAREILKIKLDLIDQEIEATRTRLGAAGSIGEADERAKTEAELNGQLKILTEQRKSIQAEGNRDIEEGRQEDLENERRYADEISEIRSRIRDVMLDNAAEVIRLMRIHFASRRDIIRAQLQLDINEENTRHEQALETLDNLKKESDESNRTQEERLEFEKEINALREAEAERHRLAMQGIRDQAKQEEKEADPLGRIDLDTENLKEFASIIESSIVPLGEILTRTFHQVADAIGQTVQNWVLLGETGPAVMRKILAQALASIAAEAAVNAIKELALGFATLFFNPAESAAHFTAAGLWGAIAGGSALAGRTVAGDLFKQKSAAGGAGSGGGSGSGSRNERDPIDLTRQQVQVLEIRFHGEPGPGFRNAILSTVVDDVRSNGPMRTTIKDVTEG